MLNRLIAQVAASLIFLAVVKTASAHDPGLSSANLDLKSDGLHAVLTFNERDIAGVLNLPAAALLQHGAEAKLNALRDGLVVVERDGTRLVPDAATVTHDGNNNVEFSYTFRRVAAEAQLLFRSALLPDLAFGHREAFTLRDEAGIEVLHRLLSARENTVAFTSGSAPQFHAQQPFLPFLLLGIRHILTGYDHLLFLFGLLVMCRRGKTAALLITCFTAAHSLTLALSTFGLVHLQSRFVEAAIAASILYVGLENLIRGERPMRGRALLTFAFGLVHGLGFASVLREMGVANSGIAAVIPLVGFNAGVEVGQLSVAAVILPLVWLLRRRDLFVRVGIPACSIAVALAGACWLIERTLF